ncbi:MAG: hypothetical protein IPJ71_12600 [Bdellovibrionales bacterium]|nr:hypothetical protein [Bdellovibrionales bacterium]
MMQQTVTKELLKDQDANKDLQVALADILQGIREEWDLSTADIAAILSLPESTVKGWLRPGGHIGLSTVVDHNTQAIIDFIDIYNMVASFFVKKTDQISWFKSRSERYANQSPMEMIITNPHNLVIAKQLVSRMLNP